MRYGISYDRPSGRYEEALPIGNGRLGAMVSGSVKEKQIWINEETVWYGGPRDRNNPDARSHLDEIRSLVAAGNIKEAERLAVLTLTGVPESQRHYTTLGMVVIDSFGHDGEVTDYSHTLDFETAVTCTRYRMDGVQYEMRVFASLPDAAIVIRITASEPVLDFFAGIERGERVAQFSYGTHEDEVLRDSRMGVIMQGSCGGQTGLTFAGGLFGESNGTTTLLGDKIVVRHASEAVLYITAGTNYADRSMDVVRAVTDRALAARTRGYEGCQSRHLEEWQPLYLRASVELKRAESVVPPAMNRLFDAFEHDDYSLAGIGTPEQRQALDDYLVLLLFHFGRYVLLSSSRDCELPANLQGIWCRDLIPAWDGKYTTNINLQMAYWPADSANLSECFMPYLQLAERIRENGLVTAETMYGCRGFVLHNNTDLWADTAVQDAGTHCSYWFLGGVWIAVDLFEHYRYTLDLEFLRRAWPILRDAARFILDFMVERDGELVMGVTSSPENFYYAENGDRVSFCEMTAMDSQMIPLLFRNCLQAAERLSEAYGSVEMDPGFPEELRQAIPKVRGTKIGKDGAILEWGIEVREAEPSHRHQSHLLGVYPYNELTRQDERMLRAVGESIDKRVRNGGCNTGWGRAWGAGILARLGRGDEARDMVGTMARYSGQPNLFCCCNIGRIPKLLDNAMPMQIDGTMGTVQATIEMLLQSHDGELRLLPALPRSWSEGSFSGLVARGNIEVSAIWREGRLELATLTPRCDGPVAVAYRDGYTLETPAGEKTLDHGKATYMAKAGETVRLVPSRA